MNPKAIWIYSDDSTSRSFAQNVSEVPQDLPRRYRRASAAAQQPSWSLLEGGWPSGGWLLCLRTALHQAAQLAPPFTQINSDNTVLPQ